MPIKHVGLFTLIDEFTILDRYHDRMAYIDSSGGYATTAAHMHGAAGWVTEIAPFWPEFEMKYWDLLEPGDYKAAQLWRHRSRRSSSSFRIIPRRRRPIPGSAC